jgi:hypothetical protein
MCMYRCLEDVQWLEDMRDWVITVHIFHALVHFCGSFAQFKVTFDHSTSLHVETFDTWNKHAYFDGDKTTTTDAVEKSTL